MALVQEMKEPGVGRRRAKKQFFKYIGSALALLVLAGNTFAAQIPLMFTNEFDADSSYLFIIDGKYKFDDKKLTNSVYQPGSLPSSWGVDVLESSRLVISGDPLVPFEGTFVLDMFGKAKDGPKDIATMEWAEVLNGTIAASGTLTISGTGIITGSSYGPITSEVPIPDAYWLLGSGLILFVAIRRKKEASAVAY